MAAYVITSVIATDPEKFGQYINHIQGLIDKHGGEYIVRGPVSHSIEGQAAENEKIIVSKFADKASALAYYADPIYQAGKQMRKGAGTVKALLVEM